MIMQTVDYRDDVLTNAALYYGRPELSEIEIENDNDWFKVQLIAGVAYTFTLQGIGNEDEKLTVPLLQGLFNSTGVLVADLSVELNDQAQLSFTPSESGEYFIETGARDSGVGAYQLAMDITNVTLVDGLKLGLDQEGELIDGAGVNAHRLSLKAGLVYSINLNGASFDGVANSRGVLQLVTDENGVVHFSPLVSEDYFLLASTPVDQSGIYQLSVTPDIIIDNEQINLKPIDAPVALGVDVAGDIDEAFNNDLHHVWLEADQIYQVDLEGKATDKGTQHDVLIGGIYNSHGELLANTGDDDSGVGHNARVQFTSTEAGFYYINAGAYQGNLGTYTLYVDVVDLPNADDFGMVVADELPVGSLQMNTAKAGDIEVAGDRDGFQFTVRSGFYYTIDVEGAATDLGSLYDPVLAGLYNTAGELLVGYADDDSGVGLNSRLSAAVDFDADLYLEVGAHNEQATGTYTVTITEEFIVVPPAGVVVQDEWLVVDGDAQIAQLEAAFDVEWFHLEISEAGDYLIDIKGYQGANDIPVLEDPRLVGIYDSDGQFILHTQNDDGGIGLNARLTFTAAPGDYYVSAAAWREQVGGYSVSVKSINPDDYGQNKDADNLGAVTVDSSDAATGVIETESDQDWFRVRLEADSYYQIDLIDASGSTVSPLVPNIQGVYNASGQSVLVPGETASILFNATASADYFIAAAGNGASTGSYELSVTSADAPDGEDLSADIASLGVVELGQSVNGFIDFSGDMDWFRVSVERDVSYRISLEGSGLADPMIEGIYTSEGGKLNNSFDDDNGAGLNSIFNFIPRLSGDYFISTTGAGTGAYQLTMSVNPNAYDDLPETIATLANIKVGGSSIGVIETAGDIDWFEVSLNPGQTYMIGMEGGPTSLGTLPDSIIKGVYDAAGVLISNSGDDHGGKLSNALLTFTPTGAGIEAVNYYIAATAYQDDVGSYTVTVNTALNDDFNDSVSGTLSIGDAANIEEIKAVVEGIGVEEGEGILFSTATGVIENSNDKDWFAVYLVQGQQYTVTLTGSTGEAGLSDTVLEGIYRSNGSFISGTFNDDMNSGTSDSQIIYTAGATDVYYVSAGGFAIETGSYDLAILPIV